jgi:hypothetical protein
VSVMSKVGLEAPYLINDAGEPTRRELKMSY